MTTRSALVVGALVFLDQVSKFLISSNVKLHESIPIIRGVFHITRVYNTGAAFGLLKGMLALFIILSLVTMLLIFLYTKKCRKFHSYVKMGLFLILAGTFGNLIDRLRLGCVIDFIDVRIWPVFNFADIMITVGAGFLVYDLLIAWAKSSSSP